MTESGHYKNGCIMCQVLYPSPDFSRIILCRLSKVLQLRHKPRSPMCVCLCVHGCTYYICTHAKRSHIHVKDPVVHVTRHQSLVAYGNIKQESNPVCTKNTTGQQDCFRVYNCDKYRRDHFISESVSWFGPAVSGRTSVRYCFSSPFSLKRLWFVVRHDITTVVDWA